MGEENKLICFITTANYQARTKIEGEQQWAPFKLLNEIAFDIFPPAEASTLSAAK